MTPNRITDRRTIWLLKELPRRTKLSGNLSMRGLGSRQGHIDKSFPANLTLLDIVGRNYGSRKSGHPYKEVRKVYAPREGPYDRVERWERWGPKVSVTLIWCPRDTVVKEGGRGDLQSDVVEWSAGYSRVISRTRPSDDSRRQVYPTRDPIYRTLFIMKNLL